MSNKNLNICKYTCVKTCDEFGVNARFNLLFEEVCALKSIHPTQYVLPIASDVRLGGIKVGSGLSINSSTGVLSSTIDVNSVNHFSITSDNFEPSDGRTYLNPYLTPDNTSVYWNDVNKYLYTTLGEWVYVTGGIKILSPGFDARIYSYNLELFLKNNPSGGVMGPTTNAGDLTSGTLNDDRLSINAVTSEVVNTFADISSSTHRRLVYVIADETNNGDASLYFYNGTALKFLQTVA